MPTEQTRLASRLASLGQTKVIIQSDVNSKDRVDRIVSMANLNWDQNAVGSKVWVQQFKDALSVKVVDDEDEEEDSGPPTAHDYVMHAFGVFWKAREARNVPPDATALIFQAIPRDMKGSGRELERQGEQLTCVDHNHR